MPCVCYVGESICLFRVSETLMGCSVAVNSNPVAKNIISPGGDIPQQLCECAQQLYAQIKIPSHPGAW